MNRARLVGVIVSGGAFMAFVDSTIVNIAFPAIRATFPMVSLGSLAWIFNAYNVVFAAGLIPAGRLADRYGRRLLFEVGIVVFTLASGACAVSQSVTMLIVARVFQAVGAAILVPASLSLVVAFARPERRASAVGGWGAVAALGAAAGMPLGGVLVNVDNWRLVFLVNLPVGLVSLVAARWLVPESRDPRANRLPDLLGAGMAAGATGLLAYAIVKAPDWGWLDPRVLALIAVAVVIGVAFVRRSRSHPAPVLELSLFRVRSVAVADVLSVAAGAGYFAYILTNVLYLTSIWRYSILDAGLAVLPSAAMAALAAWPAGRAAERYGFRRVIVVGALLWCAGVVWWIIAMNGHRAYVSDFLLGQLLTGAGAGIAMSMLAGWALDSVPEGLLGIGAATNTAARQIGAVLGISLAVALIGSAIVARDIQSLKHAWMLSAGCFALVAAGCCVPLPSARVAIAVSDPGRGT